MSWRYENYGAPDSIMRTGGKQGKLEKVETTHSKYGFAYRVDGYRVYFDIPKDTKEIWAKCYAYFTRKYSNGDRIGIGDEYNNGSGFFSAGKTITANSYLFVNESSSSREIGNSIFKRDSNHTFLLHMRADASNGVVELWIDGTKANVSYTGNINDGAAFKNFYIYSSSSILISNIIISDVVIGLNENVSMTRLGFTETMDLFDEERLLKIYDTAAIASSAFKYNAAVSSLTDTLLDRLQSYEDANASTMQSFAQINLKLSGKYDRIAYLSEDENDLLAMRHNRLAKHLQLNLDKVKAQILNVKKQIENSEKYLEEINNTNNSLKRLETFQREDRAAFPFVLENLLHIINKALQKFSFFKQHQEYVTKFVEAWESWSDDYCNFKTQKYEKLKSICAGDKIDAAIYDTWYNDWRNKRFLVEQLFLPLIEFSLKGHMMNGEEAPVLKVLNCLQEYKDSIDNFYLNERKDIHQKFVFNSDGALQEKLETESEFYKLLNQFQINLQGMIFSIHNIEERFFLNNWIKPLLNASIDDIIDFVREYRLADKISSEALNQFQGLRLRDFAVYLIDSQTYGDAVQKHAKEYNSLLFRMRKDLMAKETLEELPQGDKLQLPLVEMKQLVSGK